jgi:hypothetical protein
MELILKPELFENGTYTVPYGRRTAVFTIVDEEFAGLNTLGRINRITVLVIEHDAAGKVVKSSMGTSVIGLGEDLVGVRTSVPELRGTVMNKDTMEQCVVELYE